MRNGNEIRQLLRICLELHCEGRPPASAGSCFAMKAVLRRGLADIAAAEVDQVANGIVLRRIGPAGPVEWTGERSMREAPM
jgi:hypothetical protein